MFWNLFKPKNVQPIEPIKSSIEVPKKKINLNDELEKLFKDKDFRTSSDEEFVKICKILNIDIKDVYDFNGGSDAFSENYEITKIRSAQDIENDKTALESYQEELNESDPDFEEELEPPDTYSGPYIEANILDLDNFEYKSFPPKQAIILNGYDCDSRWNKNFMNNLSRVIYDSLKPKGFLIVFSGFENNFSRFNLVLEEYFKCLGSYSKPEEDKELLSERTQELCEIYGDCIMCKIYRKR